MVWTSEHIWRCWSKAECIPIFKFGYYFSKVYSRLLKSFLEDSQEQLKIYSLLNAMYGNDLFEILVFLVPLPFFSILKVSLFEVLLVSFPWWLVEAPLGLVCFLHQMIAFVMNYLKLRRQTTSQSPYELTG